MSLLTSPKFVKTSSMIVRQRCWVEIEVNLTVFSVFFLFCFVSHIFLRCPQRISLTQGGDENIFWHTLCWFLCGSVVSLSLTSVNKVATRSMLGTAPVFTESDARYLVPFLYQI